MYVCVELLNKLSWKNIASDIFISGLHSKNEYGIIYTFVHITVLLLTV